MFTIKMILSNAIEGAKARLRAEIKRGYQLSLPNPENATIEQWENRNKPCKY
jgi:hypothetical protein|tara:strand:- start:4480 stop:4635 length:156 start_codon:yes stop_codon:yes gene_type:complete